MQALPRYTLSPTALDDWQLTSDDTGEVVSRFPTKKEAVRGAASLVTNIFCENALETALQLKERVGSGKISALSFGPESAEDSLRKALAMKADAAALVVNDGQPHPDPLAVAQVLAAAIRKLGPFDLVMVGRESGDWGVGQTGGLLAEVLGVPCVNLVDHVESVNVRAHRRPRRRADDVAAGTTWRTAELGLSLLLASRCDADLARAHERRLLRRGAGLA